MTTHLPEPARLSRPRHPTLGGDVPPLDGSELAAATVAALSDPSVLAGLGAIGAVVVATITIRMDYVARREQRVSALVSRFMSKEVATARDLLTSHESRFHDARTRHAAFVLLWTIESVGADLDALKPSYATRLAYSHGRRPRQADAIEVLYGNLARVTRTLNRYFRSDATNTYFDGSVRTANRVIDRIPDWLTVSGDSGFPELKLEVSETEDYRRRAIYRLTAPATAFTPPKGTGRPNRIQRWRRDRRLRAR